VQVTDVAHGADGSVLGVCCPRLLQHGAQNVERWRRRRGDCFLTRESGYGEGGVETFALAGSGSQRWARRCGQVRPQNRPTNLRPRAPGADTHVRLPDVCVPHGSACGCVNR
jgi:hypothetical protein